MKNIALKSLLLGAAVTATLTACDENSWNDEYLDGFEKPTITKKETVNYTLTAADITKIANLSANKALARERGESAMLEAVGKQGYFTAEITPEYYAPAWLDSLSGVKGSINYYLSEKSTLKLSFPTSDALPAELTGIQSATAFTLDDAQYQTVWDSETDYVNAFSPSRPASKYLPALLAENVTAQKDEFTVVTYNVALQDPVFGSGSTVPDNPEEPDVINSVAKTKALESGSEFDVEYELTVGFVNKSNIFACDAAGDFIQIYASNSYAVGDVIPAGWSGTYKLFNDVTPEIEATALPAATAGTFTAKEISVAQALDINTVNTVGVIKGVTFSDATPSDKVNFTGKVGDTELSFRNNYSKPGVGAGTYDVTVVVTVYNGATSLYIVSYDSPKATAAKAANIGSRAGANVASTEEKAVYKFDGSAWKLCSDVLVLTSADYSQMGVRNNLSATQAATYLPIYMSNKFPYAQKDDVYYVVYDFYDGTSTVKNFCSRATYTGTEWSLTTINTSVMQFVRASKGNGWSSWVYDPSIYIDLPAGKNSPAAPFWQACVDWVYENIDVPQFGSTSITSGIGYIPKYGNNDYFCGASSYQSNVDLRPGSARKQTPSVYGDMSDEQIVATIKHNFEEIVLPAVLAQMYPDAQPGKGVDQYYVISFVMYNGSNHDEVIRYLVTAPGTFEFVDCTWNEE